jgi:copper chaperone CopZ
MTTAAPASAAETPLRFRVAGMDCADCAKSVETVVAALPGVETARVNFGAATLTVTPGAGMTLPADDIAATVARAGYHAAPEAARHALPDQTPWPSTSFMLWQQSGAFRSLIPELHNATEAALRAADHIGTPDATRRPERAEARKCNRLSTLFLDLAPADARRTLEGLRSSNRVTVAVTHQVKCWHDLGAAMRQSIEGPAATDATFRRWVAIVGRTHFGDFMRIAAARWVAEGAKLTSLKASYQRGNRIAWNDPLAMADLAIDGADLLELGVPAGPAIGATLRRLLDVVIEDPSRNQREVLLELARPAAT